MDLNMVDVTVSIVNWNTKDELRECLSTVLSQNAVSLELNVVDNASSDGSAEMITSVFPGKVHLIENTANLGFGKAHNQSIRQSHGRYVLVLNPDTRLIEPDVLDKMVRYMDANPEIGMLGPRVLYPDGTLQFSARHFPTMFAAVFRHTIFGRFFPKNRYVREYLMTDWSHDGVTDVDWLSGSALMVRRETFEQIGLFDERFFMYCEDVDWCKRAHLHGWRVVYFPMTTITHRIGASSDKNPISMIKQHHKSMLKYYFKHYSRSPQILLTPLVLLGIWIRTRSRIKQTYVPDDFHR